MPEEARILHINSDNGSAIVTTIQNATIVPYRIHCSDEIVVNETTGQNVTVYTFAFVRDGPVLDMVKTIYPILNLTDSYLKPE